MFKGLVGEQSNNLTGLTAFLQHRPQQVPWRRVNSKMLCRIPSPNTSDVAGDVAGDGSAVFSYDYSETRSFYVAMAGTYHAHHVGLLPPQHLECWLGLQAWNTTSPQNPYFSWCWEQKPVLHMQGECSTISSTYLIRIETQLK